ncbi:hypothetical protein LCGC14_0226940 [marine sediment metagenome]
MIKLVLIACLSVALIGLQGCTTALPAYDRPPSYALPIDEDSHLSRFIQTMQPPDSQLSGFKLLHNGSDALAARLQMIELAEQSIDLQYYIYSADLTGALIADRLIAAADRGIRVRILLDDIGTDLPDFRLATLDEHHNISVRFFNPLTLRQKWLSYLSKIGEFGRINYRMHNKLVIADGQVFITGGRNIGDEYFELSDLYFQDVDIMGIGPVSRDVMRSFDEFWNSPKSVPVAALADGSDGSDIDRLRQALRTRAEEQRGNPYLLSVARSPFNRVLKDRHRSWHWGTAEWVYDPPSKASPDGAASEVPVVGRALVRHAKEARDEILMMTAYFIPGDQGEAFLMELANEGVEVKLLTNSLATNDILAVHSSYAAYRKNLLANGMQMWELRPVAAQQGRASPLFSDSLASLHAKSFVFDRAKVFVGSINLDPRSIHLNTESGVVVHQPELAKEMARLFDRWTSDDFAYRLTIAEDGSLLWRADGRTWTTEPGTSRLRRIKAWLLGLLPIEKYL